jgi:hypothetical protein
MGTVDDWNSDESIAISMPGANASDYQTIVGGTGKNCRLPASFPAAPEFNLP